MLYRQQRTIRSKVECSGLGLHSGRQVRLTLLPAPEHTGILFQRTDVEKSISFVPALYHLVTDTQLCTAITNEHGVSVATIEHLMAALPGMGVTNIFVQVDAAEVPIMDGSAEPFIFMIECAGLLDQDAPRRYLRVLEETSASVGDAMLTVKPLDGFAIDAIIDFSSQIIGRQQRRVDFRVSSFKNTLSRARTFGFEEDVARLQQAGLARGGSLDNAVVVGKDAVLNPGGLRYNDEFVRHKMLDCVGDLYLAGAQILGEISGSRIGHAVNNALLHRLLEQPQAFEWVTLEENAETLRASTRQATEASAPPLM